MTFELIGIIISSHKIGVTSIPEDHQRVFHAVGIQVTQDDHISVVALGWISCKPINNSLCFSCSLSIVVASTVSGGFVPFTLSNGSLGLEVSRHSGEHLATGSFNKTCSHNRAIGFVCRGITSNTCIAKVENGDVSTSGRTHRARSVNETVRYGIRAKNSEREHQLELILTEAEAVTITGGMRASSSFRICPVNRNIPTEADVTNGGINAVFKCIIERFYCLKSGTLSP